MFTALKTVGVGLKMLFSGSTENPANKVLDGIISGLDNRKLTDEEAVQYKKELFDKQLLFVQSQHDENSVRSKARRDIAKAIVQSELGLVWLSVLASIAGKTALAVVLFSYAKFLGTAFISVIVFYFGYYGWEKISAKKNKKGD